jgi:ATP-dependent RNA helicase DeaD
MPASRTAARPAPENEVDDQSTVTETSPETPAITPTDHSDVAQLDLDRHEVAVSDGEPVDAPVIPPSGAAAPAVESNDEAAPAKKKPAKPRASRAKVKEVVTDVVATDGSATDQPLVDNATGDTVLDEVTADPAQSGESGPLAADTMETPAAPAEPDSRSGAEATITTDYPSEDQTTIANSATTEPSNGRVDGAVGSHQPAEPRGSTDTTGEAYARRSDDDSDEPTVSFEDLGLTGALLTSLREVGYEAPSPIQVATIPDLLAGRDVIAQAQTGSGKTAAFGLPIIEQIDPSDRHVQALILCPTRELAIQVAEALHKYGKHKEVQTLPIYGGQAYERQFRGLQRGVQIVVGTPGRVMDHMRRGSLSLEFARYFVLDEADEMLDMGFIDDVDWILGQIPGDRQMSLFSATMPPRIADLARTHMKDPARITVRGKEVTVSTITQSAYEVPRSRKVDVLNRILDAEEPQSAMIFCRTKNGVDDLGEALLARGYAVETLHGDLSQAQRDRVMRRFRAGQAEILIATDVAARGLDIPDVSHVINFDIPESTEAYVHRVGRTGRAGKAGEAITLVSPRELRWLRQIERATKGKIDLRRLPTLADVADRRREAMKTLISDTLRDESNYEPYLEVVEQLAEDQDMSAIAAAVLKLYADETGRGAIVDQAEDDLATFGTAQRGRGEQGMTRLFLNIGRAQGIRPQDIVGAIANEANIPGRSIGAIDILDASTFVDVPTASVETVLQAMSTIRMKGRAVTAEVSNEAPRTGERGGDFGGRPERGDRGPGGRNFGGDRGPRQYRGGNDRGGDRGGFGGRGPAGGDRPQFGGDRPDRGPRDSRPPFDREDRGPRRFDRDERGPRRDDGPREDRPFRRDDREFDRSAGPRRFDSPAAPRRFERDGNDGGGRTFDRPRRDPQGQQPYRPFQRDENGASGS